MFSVLDQYIVAMPKAELHLHLEGAMSPRTVLALARKNRVTLPAMSESALLDFFRFRDFDHFIDVFVTICECLREPADFTRVVTEIGAEAARQNVRYQELHFNPEPHLRRRGIAFTDLLAAMNAGRDHVRERWGVELRWIADGIRDAESGPASVDITVDMIAGLPPAAGVVALGLGGNEVGYPPEWFVAPFARARAAGLHVVAHAGETTGPETIVASLDLLGAERIGHGLSAIADPALVARLARERIPLELCPTSNLRTGVVRRLSDHPLRALDAAGVMITINSDDPPLFGTTLTDEYRLLAGGFGYGPDDIDRIALQSVTASFLPQAERAALASEFRAQTARLRHELRLGPTL